MSFALTFGVVVGFLVVLLLAVAVPLALQELGTPHVLELVLAALRWVVLWFLVAVGLSFVYRFAPDREEMSATVPIESKEALHAVAYIEKPASLDSLLEAIEKHVH